MIWSLKSSLLTRHTSGGHTLCLPERHYTASSIDKGQRTKDWLRRGTWAHGCVLFLPLFHRETFLYNVQALASSRLSFSGRNISVERRILLCPSVGSGELCRVNPVRALEVGRSRPTTFSCHFDTPPDRNNLGGDTGIMAGQEWRQEWFSL